MFTADPLANFHSLANNAHVQSIAEMLGLRALPAHAHEILMFAALYFVVFYLSPVLTPRWLPQYRQLSPKNQHGFDARVASQLNSFVMCGLSLPLFFSPELDSLTSYTPYAGLVIASCIGYFVWDVYVTVVYYRYNGMSYLAHALAAGFTFSQALRPFMLNFAAPFIWFEASTPFVNMNWFAATIPGLVSEKFRKINGLLLILVFFLCRIIPGPYNGLLLFKEALTTKQDGVPAWSVCSVLLSYTVLSALNFVWFSKMLKFLVKTIKQMSKQKHE